MHFLDVLKDTANYSGFVNRNFFFWENLLFADWKLFTLKKIAIASRVVDVEFITGLALQQKLFCCLKVGSSSQGPRVYDD